MVNTEDSFHLGVKALVRNDQGKVLLLKVNLAKLHAAKEAYWDIPGGRVQRGDNVETTLRREVLEEIGVNSVSNVAAVAMVLSNIRIPLDGSDVGLILAVYSCEIPKDSKIQLSDEHTELMWAEPEEAARLLAVKYPPEFTQKLQNIQG